MIGVAVKSPLSKGRRAFFFVFTRRAVFDAAEAVAFLWFLRVGSSRRNSPYDKITVLSFRKYLFYSYCYDIIYSFRI